MLAVSDGPCHRRVSRPEPECSWQLSHGWTSRRGGRSADRRRLRRSCSLGRRPAEGGAITAGTGGANHVVICSAGASTLRSSQSCSRTQRAISQQGAVSLSVRELPSAINHVEAAARAVAAVHTWNVQSAVRDANLPFRLHAAPVVHKASRQAPPRLTTRGFPQHVHASAKVPNASSESPATGISRGESRRVRHRQGGVHLASIVLSAGLRVPERERFQHGPAQLSPGSGPDSTGDSALPGFRVIASETGAAGQAAGQLHGMGTVEASLFHRATPLPGWARTASPRATSSTASLPMGSLLVLLTVNPVLSRIPLFVPGSGG